MHAHYKTKWLFKQELALIFGYPYVDRWWIIGGVINTLTGPYYYDSIHCCRRVIHCKIDKKPLTVANSYLHPRQAWGFILVSSGSGSMKAKINFLGCRYEHDTRAVFLFNKQNSGIPEFCYFMFLLFRSVRLLHAFL